MIRNLLSRVALKPFAKHCTSTTQRMLVMPTTFRHFSSTVNDDFDNNQMPSMYTTNADEMKVLTLDQIDNKALMNQLAESTQTHLHSQGVTELFPVQ